MLELDFRKEGSSENRYSSKHRPAHLIDMQPLPSCSNGSNSKNSRTSTNSSYRNSSNNQIISIIEYEPC